ncbi:MAG: HAMP domain-containing histidine kinase [Clostridiales bacterium]|jgi:signal transduction histidine kinase|nr:HAMP domain-containing histidine kinase [Clostridiales bacterium]
MFRSIFAKHFTFYISALTVSFVILAISMSNVFSGYFMTQKSNLLKEQARRVSETYGMYSDGVVVYNVAQLRSEISVLHEYLNSSFMFVDNNRVIQLVTPDIAVYGKARFDLPEFNNAFLGETVVAVGSVGGVFDESVLTVAYPIVINEYICGVALLSAPMPEISKTVSETMRLTIICLAVSALIASILVFVLSRTMTKPLHEMSEAAKLMADGDFEKRFRVASRDEVGQLAESLNNMAESLYEQEQQRRVFIANVSHDLRSPLTSIRGFLQAIQDGAVPPEQQSRYLNIALDETSRLSKLTHDIIDLEKMRELELNKTAFDINELIRETALMFENVATSKNIAVNVSFANDVTAVLADEEKMRRVIYNLLDNAVKFSEQDGRIEIDTTIRDKKVCVSVKDYGRGIKPEDHKHVFERFFKSDASRGEDRSGSGLGLSIVAGFIKAHGETITLASDEGKGSVFTFTLPLAKEFFRKPLESEINDA